MSSKTPLLLVCGALALPAFASAAPIVYVPLGNANQIAIIDAADHRVVGTIGELTNPHGLAITPNGDRLIAGSNQESSGAAAPPKPDNVSEDDHLKHHAAPPEGAEAANSHVAVVDLDERTVAIRIGVRGAVHHNIVTPDGRYAVSTHTTTGSVSVIDLDTLELTDTVATGPVPNYLAFSSDGEQLYVSNAGNNTISELRTSNWSVERTLDTGVGPEHLVLSPDDRFIYVNNIGDGTASEISLATGETTRQFLVGSEPHGIDLSNDGKSLFIAAKGADKLTRVDLESGAMRSIEIGPKPYHVTAIDGTGAVYVSSRVLPVIWVIDAETLEVTDKIVIEGIGHQMVVAER